MNLYCKLLVTALLGLAASTAQAGLLHYNLVLSGDLNGAVHVEGASFIGGNLYSSQMSEFNHKNQTPQGLDGLAVAANISGQLKIMHGETATYNTKSSGTQLECVGRVNCSTGGVDLSATKAALSAEMVALGDNYRQLAANAAAIINNNQVRLVYTGNDDVAVFQLNAADIFFQNAGIELLLGKASKAIINVAGNVNISNTNLNGGWNYSNTLWNFYDATSVNFNYMAVKGTVLAATAHVQNSAGFDGALYAKSYTNTSLRELHGFYWTSPNGQNKVSVPALPGLLLAGFVLIGVTRYRRFSKEVARFAG